MSGDGQIDDNKCTENVFDNEIENNNNKNNKYNNQYKPNKCIMNQKD